MRDAKIETVSTAGRRRSLLCATLVLASFSATQLQAEAHCTPSLEAYARTQQSAQNSSAGCNVKLTKTLNDLDNVIIQAKMCGCAPLVKRLDVFVTGLRTKPLTCAQKTQAIPLFSPEMADLVAEC